MVYRILVINPGSTSTKMAVFENDKQVYAANLHHSNEELAPYNEIIEQRGFREKVILDWLESIGIKREELSAIVARGGLLAPLVGGTYLVNSLMVSQLEQGLFGKHASNLGAVIASSLGAEHDLPSFIVDPVTVDEFLPVARISGTPGLKRRSLFHALNQKASAEKAAQALGRPYNELNLIVAHLGGGISIGTHCRGQVIDVNNALLGDGPFSPERAGTLPTLGLIRYYFSKGGKSELTREFAGQSGLVAHLGTNDLRIIVRNMEQGDEKSLFYFQAMIYEIVKEIGRSAAVLAGEVDGIVLTGGLAHSPELVAEVRLCVEFIAPITVLPGENEMEALALGALRVLSGAEQARDYCFEGR